MATQKRIELGHQRITFLYPHQSVETKADHGMGWGHFSRKERHQGYEQAMAEANLKTHACDAPCIEAVDFLMTQIIQSRQKNKPITGIVCLFHHATMLQYALAQTQIRCPEDISIMAVEDRRDLRGHWPQISGVTCDRFGMIKR